MMRKIFVITAALFFLVGCGNQPEKTLPSVLLTESQMVDVMTDVQIMESVISYKRSVNGKTAYLKTRGFDTIFAHYGITDSIFKENYDYYIEDPLVMARIMDSVIQRLGGMKEYSDTVVADTVVVADPVIVVDENAQTLSSPSPDR
ncbi:MAG: DUF4296 domain-containing protein [Bacteroidia bacterium]|nr:DUF4296 domain-containing protein [Bacteroidia bacterium]